MHRLGNDVVAAVSAAACVKRRDDLFGEIRLLRADPVNDGNCDLLRHDVSPCLI